MIQTQLPNNDKLEMDSFFSAYKMNWNDVTGKQTSIPITGSGELHVDVNPIPSPFGLYVDDRPSPTATPATTPLLKKHAYTFLEKAVGEMKDRAAQRDVNPSHTGSPGERSMAATVKAFNALTGLELTEANGWEFMILLKLVRGRQGAFREDDYVDAAAYAGLLGECASARNIPEVFIG